MAIRTELSLRLPNSPGALGGVCRLLADEHVNILAMSVESAGPLRLVVDNHVHAAAVLRDRHHTVAERPVIVLGVSNAPGALAAALKLVDYAYGGAADGAGSALVVIGVDDAMRAAAAAGV
jgi:hypothetical protein